MLAIAINHEPSIETILAEARRILAEEEAARRDQPCTRAKSPRNRRPL
jgi:hypothetical protein